MLYELDVLVHGKKVTKYPKEGLTFIEGRNETPYTIRFTNNTAWRVLVVVSVDGLSVMDGEEASSESSGYVVDAFGTVDIPGWRLDNDEVAKFIFDKKGKSYAYKTNKPNNVGVIGCLVFMERKEAYFPGYFNDSALRLLNLGSNTIPDWTYRPLGGSDTYMGNCGGTTFTGDLIRYSHTPVTGNTTAEATISYSLDAQTVQNIGTQFGPPSAHKVVEIEFERVEFPAELIELHYDDRAGLYRRGIDTSDKVRAKVARSFKDYDNTKTIGCKPPPGWYDKKKYH